jgi:hypothetical protein
LKSHPDASKKLENMKDIVVDFNPDYPTTRCFFVVKEGDKKESFSFYKAVQQLFK